MRRRLLVLPAVAAVAIVLLAAPAVAHVDLETTGAGELAWIGEAEGDDESTSSAPRHTLVADPEATTRSAGGPSTSTTAEPTSSTDGERRAGTTLEADQRDDGSSSPGPWLIGSGIAALVAIGVGGTLLKRRAG